MQMLIIFIYIFDQTYQDLFQTKFIRLIYLIKCHSVPVKKRWPARTSMDTSLETWRASSSAGSSYVTNGVVLLCRQAENLSSLGVWTLEGCMPWDLR
jgi:hypothetical protein